MPSIYNSSVDKSLNTTHISTNYANYEAARSGFFSLILSPDEFTNLLKPDYTGEPGAATENDHLNNAASVDAIRLNVTKCPIPSFEVGTEEYRRGNDVVKFATVPTFSGGSMTVDDVVGLDTKSILYSWLYLAYNPNTRMGGRMRDYKKKATLCEYTQDYELIRQWEIEGLFVTGIQEDDFDKTADGARKMTVHFAYDRAVMKLPDEIQG